MISTNCKWCVRVFIAVLIALAVAFTFCMFYAPYFVRPISARLVGAVQPDGSVSPGPIYAGDTLVFEYKYCINVHVSDVYTEFSNGFVHALTPVRYVNVEGCPVVARFSKPTAPEWTPGKYTYKVAHHVYENPIRDALIGPELVLEPPVTFTISPRP